MENYLNLTTLAVFVLLLFIGFLYLFYQFVRLRSHYNSLVKDVQQKTLMAALEGIQKTLATHERSLVVHKKELEAMRKAAVSHLQSLTLKRFNPFSDTGGDQSFLLSILDGNQSGVVITSLHSRENTRFYVKDVKNGAGVSHPLSAEEKKLISK